jgi:hypothetical protein
MPSSKNIRVWRLGRGARRQWRPKGHSHPGCECHRSQAGSLCPFPTSTPNGQSPPPKHRHLKTSQSQLKLAPFGTIPSGNNASREQCLPGTMPPGNNAFREQCLPGCRALREIVRPCPPTSFGPGRVGAGWLRGDGSPPVALIMPQRTGRDRISALSPPWLAFSGCKTRARRGLPTQEARSCVHSSSHRPYHPSAPCHAGRRHDLPPRA